MTTLNVLLLYVARRHYNCEIHDQPPGRSQACHGSGVRYEGNSPGEDNGPGRHWTKGPTPIIS